MSLHKKLREFHGSPVDHLAKVLQENFRLVLQFFLYLRKPPFNAATILVTIYFSSKKSAILLEWSELVIYLSTIAHKLFATFSVKPTLTPHINITGLPILLSYSFSFQLISKHEKAFQQDNIPKDNKRGKEKTQTKQMLLCQGVVFEP